MIISPVWLPCYSWQLAEHSGIVDDWQSDMDWMYGHRRRMFIVGWG